MPSSPPVGVTVGDMAVRALDIVFILITIVFPPAGAYYVAGCRSDFLINILLTILGYIPGHVHAFWLIYKKMKAEKQYGAGGYRYAGGGKYEAAQVQEQSLPPPVTNDGAATNYGGLPEVVDTSGFRDGGVPLRQATPRQNYS